MNITPKVINNVNFKQKLWCYIKRKMKTVKWWETKVEIANFHNKKTKFAKLSVNRAEITKSCKTEQEVRNFIKFCPKNTKLYKNETFLNIFFVFDNSTIKMWGNRKVA